MFRKLITLLVITTVLLAGCATLLPATEKPMEPGASTDPTLSAGQDNPISSDSGGQLFPGSGQKSPLEPLEKEESMTRGSVTIDTSEVVIMESQPLQIMLHLKGYLPTPCHKLRAQLAEPNAENQINVEIYSLAEPDEICIQVLEAFESNIPLGSYAQGTYEVLVNGEQAGEFTQQ